MCSYQVKPRSVGTRSLKKKKKTKALSLNLERCTISNENDCIDKPASAKQQLAYIIMIKKSGLNIARIFSKMALNFQLVEY